METPVAKEDEPLRFLTVTETAKLLGRSPRWVKGMIRRNELPALKVASRWRVSEKQLAKWIQALHEEL